MIKITNETYFEKYADYFNKEMHFSKRIEKMMTQILFKCKVI